MLHINISKNHPELLGKYITIADYVKSIDKRSTRIILTVLHYVKYSFKILSVHTK